MNLYGAMLLFGMFTMALGMASLIVGLWDKRLSERERIAALIGGALLVVGTCWLFVLLWSVSDEIHAPLPGW